MSSPNDIPDWQGSVPDKFQLSVASNNVVWTTTITIVPAVLGKSIYLKHFSWSSWQTAAIIMNALLKDSTGTILYAFNWTGTAGGVADLSGLASAPGASLTLGPGDPGAHVGLAYNLTYFYS